MAALSLFLLPSSQPLKPSISQQPTTGIPSLHSNPFIVQSFKWNQSTPSRGFTVRAAVNGNNSARRINGELKEDISLPGCDFKHWLIIMGFPKDPAPTREEMIDTYLNTLASVVGSMEEAKKNMYAFSTTTYTGFQCTVDQETSEKFKGLPGVIWVLPDSYIDVKNQDYGGDKYINGKIIPCKYPTPQTKQRNTSKFDSKNKWQRDGPPRTRKPKQEDPPL